MATTVTLKPNAIDISGSTSGTTTLQATAVAGTTTITLPAATDTLVGKATTDTLTNKTLTGAVMNGTVGATTPSTGSFTSLDYSTTLTGGTGIVNLGSGQFYKDASGNVGIGTSSPSQKLVLSNAGAGNVLLCENTTASIQTYLQSGGTTGVVGTLTNHPFTLFTNNTERMRISSGGYVTMPYQPIFAAYRTSAQTGTSPFTILFDTASLNVGSNYSTSTGRFTAPIAGNYYLIFQTLGITGTWNSLDIILYKNGSSTPTILSARPTSTAGTEAVSNLSTAFGIVTLAASDYVEIKVVGTTIYSDGNAWLKFGGWLVC